MRYLNQLEPNELIDCFLNHPPVDFQTIELPQGIPAFVAKFDLLTTMDAPAKRIVTSLPLYRIWGRWLKPRTCFIGTTVSEYALFNKDIQPREMIRLLKKSHASHYPFLIIKDLPQGSPLLGVESNQYAAEIAIEAQRAGFVLLEGQALAYLPIDFNTIEEYYKRLSYKRRKDIRRKLRSRAELEIKTAHTGSQYFADRKVTDQFYQLYCHVYDQSEIHFDLHDQDFFRSTLQDPKSGGVVFIYHYREELIGFNLCFEVNGNLVDKYVGFLYPSARDMNLYFVSWIQNIEYMLTHGLKTLVAGWTDPEIKAYLGSQFTFTRHAVYVRNPLLRVLLRMLSSFFESDRIWRDTKTKHEQPSNT